MCRAVFPKAPVGNIAKLPQKTFEPPEGLGLILSDMRSPDTLFWALAIGARSRPTGLDRLVGRCGLHPAIAVAKHAASRLPLARLRADPLRRRLHLGTRGPGIYVPRRARRHPRRGDHLPRPPLAGARAARSGTCRDPDLPTRGPARPRQDRDRRPLARSRPPRGPDLLRRLHLRRAPLAHHLHLARHPGPHRLRLRRGRRHARHPHLPPRHTPKHRRLRRLRSLSPPQPQRQGKRRPHEAATIAR